MIKVGIVGGTGKLGKDIIKLLSDQTDILIGAVVARKGNPFVGNDLGSLIDGLFPNILIEDNIPDSINKCDIYIDCTSAEAMMSNYDAYRLANKPVIIATTGFNTEDIERLSTLSSSIPIVICPNFSIGVFKFLKLNKLAATEFGMNSDIDIFEYHHKYKKDKPSGTAIAIAHSIKDTGLEDPINIHSVRSGNIIGEHSVMFTTNDNERIEIAHKIYSRAGFSKGVIETIKWISSKQAGLYGIEDIFE